MRKSLAAGGIKESSLEEGKIDPGGFDHQSVKLQLLPLGQDLFAVDDISKTLGSGVGSIFTHFPRHH